MKGFKKKIRDNRLLNWILIFSNWMFQGILHADNTEKIYKVSFTLVLWPLCYLLIAGFFPNNIVPAIMIGFIISHTLNWIVNGNFYNLLIHRLMVANLSKTNLFAYLDNLQKRLESEDWISYSASFGSICKGKLKDTSDVDVSIVRKPGFINAIKSILFAAKEKKRADLKRIPLELYISDSPGDSIRRFGGEKNPVVLFDPESVIRQYYEDQLSIEEAKKLNGIG